MRIKLIYLVIFLFLMFSLITVVAQDRLGIVEAESGSGNGATMFRSYASGFRTKHFAANQALTIRFYAPETARYNITLYYSNDNHPPPTEIVQISVDNQLIGQFLSVDTGDWGNGWNSFASSPTFVVDLMAGSHLLVLTAQGGDAYGIEADKLIINLLVEGEPAIYPPDSRINWQYGDLYAVLYHAFDETGNPALHVYCADGEIFSLSMIVSEATIHNGMRAGNCDVSVYIIDEQIQVNINFDGKLYEIVADDLRFIEPNLRYFDPNE